MLQPSAGIAVYLLLTLLGVTLGALIVLVGKRLRRVDDHPTCRRCRFDLVGLGPEHDTCPECGAPLSGERSIRIGNRRPSIGVVVVGVLIALVSVLAGGGVIALRVSGADANTYKPAWLLAREAKGAGTASARALAELQRRLQGATLSQDTTKRLVSIGLDRQQDPARPWDPAWGDFLDAAWNSGLMTDDERLQFITRGVTFSLKTRPRAVIDAPLAVQLQCEPTRLGVGTSATIDFRLHSLVVAGEDNTSDVAGNFTFNGVSRSSRSSIPRQSLKARPGPTDMTATWDVTFTLGRPDAVVRQPIVLRKPIEVLDAGADPVERVTDPRVAAVIQTKIKVSTLTLHEGDRQLCDIQLDFDSLPCHLVGDTYLRERPPADAPAGFTPRQWLVSPHFLNPNNGPQSSSWQGAPLSGPRPFDLETVDVVLIPSMEMAAGDPGVESMWGSELIIPGVQVKRTPADK